MRYISTLCLLIVIPLTAKEKKPKKPTPQDAIEVVAHIPLTAGPVRRFLTTEHYSSHYLYAEHDTGSNVTLIDISKPTQPSVLGEVAYPSVGPDSLVVVSGTAALVTSSISQTAPIQTLRVLDFSDPQHPKVAREFAGVTAINRDDRRGLIFIANAEGVWVLHQSRAEDPEVEKAYARHVVYDH